MNGGYNSNENISVTDELTIILKVAGVLAQKITVHGIGKNFGTMILTKLQVYSGPFEIKNTNLTFLGNLKTR